MDNSNNIYWQDFTVAYRYPVVFGRKLFSPENRTFLDALQLHEKDKKHRVLFVVDGGMVQATPGFIASLEAYASAHSDAMELVTQPLVIPGGEELKARDRYYWQLVEVIHQYHIDRHSYFVAIGGGSLLDMAGFVAATSHRGVRHIRIPTTVLSQNDSGVGVKNSINFLNQKNFVGTFAPPSAVLCDFDFLETLSSQDKIAGMAEAVKVALIRDGEFFKKMEADIEKLKRFEAEPVEYMVRRCAELHMNQIAHGGDPFESGSARPLDFGHWAAHKLEVLSHYELRHGEAVAIGVALDARYSTLSGLLPDGEDLRIAQFLNGLGFQLATPLFRTQSKGHEMPDFLRGLHEFREHLGGKLTITLLESVGKGVEVHEMDDARIMDAVTWLEDNFA